MKFKLLLLTLLAAFPFFRLNADDQPIYVVKDGIRYSLHHGVLPEHDYVDFYALVEAFEENKPMYFIPEFVVEDGVTYSVYQITSGALIGMQGIGLDCPNYQYIPRSGMNTVGRLISRSYDLFLSDNDYWNELTEYRFPYASQNLSNYNLDKLPKLYKVYSGVFSDELNVSSYSECPLEEINIAVGTKRVSINGVFPELSVINCMALTPPDAPILPSDNDILSNVQLNVPVGKEEVYRNDAAWGRFAHIKGCLDLEGNRVDVWEEIDGIVYGYTGDCYSVIYLSDPNLETADIQPYVTVNGSSCQIERIGVAAFMNSDITGVIIPDGIKEIDDLAFYGCSNLKQDWTPTVFLPNSVEKIGDLAFAKTESVSNKLPTNLKSIGYGGFDNGFYPGAEATIGSTKDPVYLNFPEGMTHLGQRAVSFETGANILAILPSTLTDIDEEAFYNPYGINNVKGEVYFRNNETSMEQYINNFYIMSMDNFIVPSGIRYVSMLKVGLPKKVTVGEDVSVVQTGFYCNDLYMLPDIPPRFWEEFATESSVNTLHVKKGNLEVYENDPLWGSFENIVADIDFQEDDNYSYQLDLTAKTATLLKYNGEAMEIKIPSYVAYGSEMFPVVTIADQAFPDNREYNGCVKSLELPEAIKQINNLAFMGYTLGYNSEVICRAQTPPSISSIYSLTPYFDKLNTLYVQDDLIDTYRASNFGKKFEKVLGLSDLVTNVSQIADERDGVMIFDINGRLLLQTSNISDINLPNGVFIVKEGQKVYKLIK